VKEKTKGKTLTKNESPLDILKKRYAKGEINKEDFDRMKRDFET
jgi:putative membrane protein